MMGLTKHEQIIRHIVGLHVGHKISVRQIAKDLSVSEGTAYRAIKEAENQGLVSTMDRVGTIRIEKKEKEDRKSTRLNSSHVAISYAVFCLKKKASVLPPTLV